MAGKGLFIVRATIPPEKEEAFNRWYNEEHMPLVMERIPGILSGRRYKIIEGEEKYPYMAMYEFASYEALEAGMDKDSPQIKHVVNVYNKAFGEGNRYHVRCIELKNLIVG